MTPHAADYYAGAFILALAVICCIYAPLIRPWADRTVAGMVHRWELSESFGPAAAYGPLDEDAETFAVAEDYRAFIDALAAQVAAEERAEFERAVRADIAFITEEIA